MPVHQQTPQAGGQAPPQQYTGSTSTSQPSPSHSPGVAPVSGSGTYGTPAPASPHVPAPANLGQIPPPPKTFAARAQVSVPPAGTSPASAPPATGLYQASAPPASGVYQASGPGIYQASAPPAQDHAAPGEAGVYQASAPPAGQVTGPVVGGPKYSDLVNFPSDPPADDSTPPGSDGASSASAPAPPAKSRRGLVLGVVIVVVVFLLAVAGTGIVVALNNAGSTNFAVNSCVKQDGDSAKKVDCGDKDAFTITQKVDKAESCSDAAQPYVVLQHKGQKDQVLCLRPASQK